MLYTSYSMICPSIETMINWWEWTLEKSNYQGHFVQIIHDYCTKMSLIIRLFQGIIHEIMRLPNLRSYCHIDVKKTNFRGLNFDIFMNSYS